MSQLHPSPSETVRLLAQGRPSFSLLSSSGRALRLRMPSSRCVIGRGEDCDIRLPDPRRRLSRAHVLIERRGSGLRVTDLSRNGCWLDGERIVGGPQHLGVGQRLSLGEWTLVPEEGRAGGKDATTLDGSGVLDPLESLVGASPAMLRLREQILGSGSYELPVLIGGETGTGKELVARALHGCSILGEGPFVAVNCGAIPTGTAASELFGHQRGAFTGASESRLGAFRRAEGGTLFLDELGELPLPLQAALLRVLETREVLPLGGEQPVPVRFRLLSATHRDLGGAVERGEFRADLYYRVNVISMSVPALRDRRQDIAPLARHFAAEYQGGRPVVFDARSVEQLEAHTWPGNVRELRNVVLRALVASGGGPIRAEHIELGPVPAGCGSTTPFAVVPPARLAAGDAFQEIVAALGRNGGNRSRAARELGISRSTLYARLERHTLGLEG